MVMVVKAVVAKAVVIMTPSDVVEYPYCSIKPATLASWSAPASRRSRAHSSTGSAAGRQWVTSFQ